MFIQLVGMYLRTKIRLSDRSEESESNAKEGAWELGNHVVIEDSANFMWPLIYIQTANV